jgi:hypothetical protein
MRGAVFLVCSASGFTDSNCVYIMSGYYDFSFIVIPMEYSA